MEALSVEEIARAAQGVLMNFEGEYEVSGYRQQRNKSWGYVC